MAEDKAKSPKTTSIPSNLRRRSSPMAQNTTKLKADCLKNSRVKVRDS